MSESRPFIDVLFTKGDLSATCSCLIDTGADITCITQQIAKQLQLRRSLLDYGQMMVFLGQHVTAYKYSVDIKIGDDLFRDHPVIVIPNLSSPLIGWDVLAQGNVLSRITSRVFTEVVHLLGSVDAFKRRTVLVLGQDSTEIHRLRTIQQRLNELSYTGIIVKDISDIEIQSLEEKVNMLASLCRFVICDNSIASGHIDELKICASNRFVTAILQEEGLGATWMQADYPLDFSFMKTFKYANTEAIAASVDMAVAWAEEKLEERRKFLNDLYQWR